MEYKDYYQILGVERDADGKDIKRAFRKLARQYHPDVNPDDAGAEEHFKEINEAYEVLSDVEKRQKYDQLGTAWHDWDGRGGQPNDFDWSRWGAGAPGGQRANVRYGTAEDLQDLFGGASPFSDFFSQIFGAASGMSQEASAGQRYRTQPRRGQDYEQEVEIGLREAYDGTTRLLQLDSRRLQVKIPAGARTGTRVRLSGEGGPGTPGGEAGDMYLRVKVLPDGQFERKDDDLHSVVPVDMYTAVLGGRAQVSTLSGTVNLTVPAGTQNGKLFRLRGKGMPRIGRKGKFGDLYVKAEVQLPTDLTHRQQELFEELRRLSGLEADA